MVRLFLCVFGLFLLSSFARADEPQTDAAPLGPISMDWEGTPVRPPPHAWVGLGVAWSTEAQTQAGVPWGAGLDFTWVTLTSEGHHTLQFTQRTWRAPTQAVEDRLKRKGVSEGVQGFWSGRMVLSGLHKVVNATQQTSHYGAQLGWRLQRTQHVGETTQKALLRDHDLYWGPQWTAHLGPELHVGFYGGEETLQMTAYGRVMMPLYAQLNSKGEGIVLDGKMWDPVQTVAPEAETGVALSGRMDPYFVRLSTGLRSLGSSVRESRGGASGWQHAGTVDVAISQAF